MHPKTIKFIPEYKKKNFILINIFFSISCILLSYLLYQINIFLFLFCIMTFILLILLINFMKIKFIFFNIESITVKRYLGREKLIPIAELKLSKNRDFISFNNYTISLRVIKNSNELLNHYNFVYEKIKKSSNELIKNIEDKKKGLIFIWIWAIVFFISIIFCVVYKLKTHETLIIIILTLPISTLILFLIRFFKRNILN